MRRNINTAILLSTSKAEHMIIFINCTANCTKRIMTVCQNIWQGKFFQSRSTSRLNNSDISYIMRSNFIKFNFQFCIITRSIMILQNRISHSFFSAITDITTISRFNQFSVNKISTRLPKFHKSLQR